MGVVRWLYFGALAVWTLYIVLNPPWIGHSYNWDQYSQTPAWQSKGTFGLRGYPEMVPRSPVWNPPVAHSDMIAATVRWPWQNVSNEDHVELSLVSMARLLSYGLMALGFSAGLMSFARTEGRRDRVITYAWSVALCLVIAWIAIVVLSVASMGYAATPGIVTGLLAAGVVGGLIYGCISSSRKAARHSAAVRLPGKLADEDLMGSRNQKKTSRWKPGRMNLLFFVIGLVTSCFIAWTAIDVAVALAPSQLLGASVNGFGEVSGWMRALTGLGIAALGTVLGVLLWWATWVRGFAFGLIVGSTSLGILCIIWH